MKDFSVGMPRWVAGVFNNYEYLKLGKLKRVDIKSQIICM